MRWTWWVLCLLSVVVALESADAAGARSSNGRIAFSTGFVLPYGDRDVGPQIFVVNPVGTGLQQLTHVAGGHDAANPAWSPDGRRIVYQSNPAGEYDLWVMNGDGSGQHRRCCATPAGMMSSRAGRRTAGGRAARCARSSSATSRVNADGSACGAWSAVTG
jgi:dipeptidyl aminopeptidase/acylaminoacyl peptidase